MPEANVEIVRAALERFSAGDFERPLELIHEDALWAPSGRFIGSGDEYRGHAGVRRFWAEFTEPWQEITLDPVEAVELDDEHVLTNTRFQGVGRTSGVATETHLAQLWTVKGGAITRFESFATWAEALEAIHSRESGP
jgi:ketosteroid isomerase-like protein